MTAAFRTVEWIGDIDGYLRLLNQTRLPSEVIFVDCRTAEDVWQAITRLMTRPINLVILLVGFEDAQPLGWLLLATT
jgi:methylthioribose-1-phosphate isomerase